MGELPVAPVSVHLTFNHSTGVAQPRRVNWDGQTFNVHEVREHRSYVEGRTRIHAWLVMAEGHLLRLLLDTDTLGWTRQELDVAQADPLPFAGVQLRLREADNEIFKGIEGKWDHNYSVERYNDYLRAALEQRCPGLRVSAVGSRIPVPMPNDGEIFLDDEPHYLPSQEHTPGCPLERKADLEVRLLGPDGIVALVQSMVLQGREWLREVDPIKGPVGPTRRK